MNRDQYLAKRALLRPDPLAAAVGRSAAVVAASAERRRCVDLAEYRRQAERRPEPPLGSVPRQA